MTSPSTPPPTVSQSIPTISAPRIPRGTSQSFESLQLRRKATRDSRYLTDLEQGELSYIWREYTAELGVRSIQSAIESRLLLAPPRNDARPHIVEELERAGGRAPEGKVITIVVAEGWGTKYETRKSLALLVSQGRVQREVSNQTPDTLPKDWTGMDLVLCEAPLRLALASVSRGDGTRGPHRTRWSRQDDALERMWREIPCGSGSHGYRNWAPDDARQSAMATRILGILCSMPPRAVAALYRVYGTQERCGWAEAFGGELGPLVEQTRRVREDREALIEKLTDERLRVSLDLCVPVRVDRERIRRQCAAAISPAMVVRRAMAGSGRAEFIQDVKKEAEAMLLEASGEYKRARRGAL